MKIRSLAATLALPLFALTNACSGSSSTEAKTETGQALDGTSVAMTVGPSETIRQLSGIDAKGTMHALRVTHSSMWVGDHGYEMLRHVYSTQGVREAEWIAALSPLTNSMFLFLRTKEGTAACYVDDSVAPYGEAHVTTWQIPARDKLAAVGTETADLASVGGGKVCMGALTSLLSGHTSAVSYFAPSLAKLADSYTRHLVIATPPEKDANHNKGIALAAGAAGGFAVIGGIAAAVIIGAPITLTVGAGIAATVILGELSVLVGDAIVHHFDEKDKEPAGVGSGGAQGPRSSNETDEGAESEVVASLDSSEDVPNGGLYAGPDDDGNSTYPPGTGTGGPDQGPADDVPCAVASQPIFIQKWCF